jgi:hypothetical protein
MKFDLSNAQNERDNLRLKVDNQEQEINKLLE